MLATTSADRRNPICTLGVSAFGRPVFPRWRSIASTSSGIASRIGFILRISARVSSRTSPSSSIGGPFRLGSLIAPHLSIVCLAQADDPKCVASDSPCFSRYLASLFSSNLIFKTLFCSNQQSGRRGVLIGRLNCVEEAQFLLPFQY